MSKNMTVNQFCDLEEVKSDIECGFYDRWLYFTTDGFMVSLTTFWKANTGRHLTYYAADFAENWHRRASKR